MVAGAEGAGLAAATAGLAGAVVFAARAAGAAPLDVALLAVAAGFEAAAGRFFRAFSALSLAFASFSLRFSSSFFRFAASFSASRFKVASRAALAFSIIALEAAAFSSAFCCLAAALASLASSFLLFFGWRGDLAGAAAAAGAGAATAETGATGVFGVSVGTDDSGSPCWCSSATVVCLLNGEGLTGAAVCMLLGGDEDASRPAPRAAGLTAGEAPSGRMLSFDSSSNGGEPVEVDVGRPDRLVEVVFVELLVYGLP